MEHAAGYGPRRVSLRDFGPRNAISLKSSRAVPSVQKESSWINENLTLRKEHSMQVKDIMSSSCVVARTTDTLEHAARVMRDRDIGFMPVVDNDRAVGVITDRDIATRAVADGRPTSITPVGDVMTQGLTCCNAESDVAEALKIMGTERVRRLPVANLQGEMVGTVSLTDVARVASRDDQTAAALSDICACG